MKMNKIKKSITSFLKCKPEYIYISYQKFETTQQQNQKPQRPKTINEIKKSKKAETMSAYWN